MKKKICVFVGSRANYSSIKSVIAAISKHSMLELQLVLGASAILSRFGDLRSTIEADGFKVSATINMLVEGDNPLTMAKSTGLGLIDFTTVLDILRPDIVLVVGDRFEIMSAVIAAAYMNIPVAHTMGGEVSGTIDESIRHAVTKLSHLHFVSNSDAASRVLKLGEQVDRVFNVGCPRLDLVRDFMNSAIDKGEIANFGVGSELNFDEPFLLVSQHPVTTEFGVAGAQMLETLVAVSRTGMQALVLWPNSDAGTGDISREIRKWREEGRDDRMRFVKNMPPSVYIKLMVHTACLVGNSSSGIREGAFIGTPVVNIGLRQNSRLHGKNVKNVDADSEAIFSAIMEQVTNGRYPSEAIYGDGFAGERVANIIASIDSVSSQKRITY